MLTVFLSSTSKDLKLCRDAAFRAVEGLHGYHCVRMEDFGAVDEAPDDFCRVRVGECDLFVCIAGPLYGSRSPTGLSFTEREYDAAILAKKACLVFMTSDDYPIAANLVESDENRERQLEFRKKVRAGRIITQFSTGDEMSVKVVQAIRNWEVARAENRPSPEALLASQIRSVSYRVAVMNEGATVSDEEVRAAVAALQTQLNRDFCADLGRRRRARLRSEGRRRVGWLLAARGGGQFALPIGGLLPHTDGRRAAGSARRGPRGKASPMAVDYGGEP